MSCTFRRALPEDVAHCAHLYVCDKPMLSPELWRRFPALLADLLGRQRILLVLVHEPSTGRRRMLGGSAFLDPAFAYAALAHPEQSLLQQCLEAEIRGKSAFLGPKRQARENAQGELILYNFLCVPDFGGMAGPDGNLLFALINEAWRFHHYGFRLKSFYSESTNLQHAEFMEGMNLTLVRERAMANGEVARAYAFTREDAIQKPGGNVSLMFIAPPPRLGYALGEQALLELALMDHGDGEISDLLHVTPDAIKKRWRSIYERTRAQAPELLPDSVTGPQQRRLLLQYLRHHLEEIRPYEVTPAG